MLLDEEGSEREDGGQNEGGVRRTDEKKEAGLWTLSLFPPRPRDDRHKSLHMVIRGTEVGAGVYNMSRSWSGLIKVTFEEKQREKACPKR